jgi:hypothetical protein
VESLQSHMILTHVSLVQWTNLFASRHKGHRFKSPGGDLCENRDSPVSVVSLQYQENRCKLEDC